MASSTAGDRPPVRISKVAGRYLLFDIDDVMHLRRRHNICAVFAGTIPQNPQQNIFMGLPVELMPEEAQVLVDKGVGHVVDDAVFHPARLSALGDGARRRYLQAVKAEGRMAQMAAAELKESSRPKNIVNKKKARSKTPEVEGEVPNGQDDTKENAEVEGDEPDTALFAPPSPISPTPRPSKAVEEPPTYAITPTTSALLYPNSSSPTPPPPPPSSLPSSTPIDEVPASYPLYAHLQDRGYYMMPGLRFGCDYNVYPGDPLRFHSHFQAASHGWDDPVAVLDLVAGGRLGTNVKKGYLVGGAVGEDDGGDGDDGDGDVGAGSGGGDGVREDGGKGKGEDGFKRVDGSWNSNPNPNAPKVRAFTIEWAAM